MTSGDLDRAEQELGRARRVHQSGRRIRRPPRADCLELRRRGRAREEVAEREAGGRAPRGSGTTGSARRAGHRPGSSTRADQRAEPAGTRRIHHGAAPCPLGGRGSTSSLRQPPCGWSRSPSTDRHKRRRRPRLRRQLKWPRRNRRPRPRRYQRPRPRRQSAPHRRLPRQRLFRRDLLQRSPSHRPRLPVRRPSRRPQQQARSRRRRPGYPNETTVANFRKHVQTLLAKKDAERALSVLTEALAYAPADKGLRAIGPEGSRPGAGQGLAGADEGAGPAGVRAAEVQAGRAHDAAGADARPRT